MTTDPLPEPEILAEDRDQLTMLLVEAAEIEHGLMCCYLYAAYSLKRGAADGLTAEQSAAVARWRSALVDVAIDEMLHLALVSNLLTALGSAPHFERPNLPVSAGYHPAGVVVALAPFSPATLDHFIFLERPEGVDLPDGDGFDRPAPYHRAARRDGLVASAQDYATVGHLYRGIRAGLVHLTEKLGAGTLFVGDPAAQVSPDMAPLDGLVAVTDLASAVRAVDTIVAQGEGTPEDSAHSHYQRFVSVRTEYLAMRALDPDFDPALPVARNPVMRKPPEPRGKVHIDHPATARVMDVGNAVYALALRCLARAFGQSQDPPAARSLLVETSIEGMRLVGLVAGRLAHLPAHAATDGVNAGLSFTMQRQTVGFTQQHAAWAILVERAREIARVCETLAATVEPLLAPVARSLYAAADRLAAGAPVGAPSVTTAG